jgi:hypothetical protein
LLLRALSAYVVVPARAARGLQRCCPTAAHPQPASQPGPPSARPPARCPPAQLPARVDCACRDGASRVSRNCMEHSCRQSSKIGATGGVLSIDTRPRYFRPAERLDTTTCWFWAEVSTPASALRSFCRWDATTILVWWPRSYRCVQAVMWLLNALGGERREHVRVVIAALVLAREALSNHARPCCRRGGAG